MNPQQKTVRPWGQYEKIFEESGVWVKRVEVNVGARLSLQKHQKRSEKWIIVSGQGLVTIHETTVMITNGSVIDVPVEAVHRMANVGKTPLIFIEVACGSYLAEDDIVRLEDDYVR